MDNDDVLVEEPIENNDNDALTEEDNFVWVEDFLIDDDLLIEEEPPLVEDLLTEDDDILTGDSSILENPIVIKDNSLNDILEPKPSTDLEKLEQTFRPRFEYKNKSTVSIIGTPMILVSTSTIDDPSTSRNKIQGDSTISRLITNEYGTIYEPLSFTYGLMKVNYAPFTERE